MRQFFCLNQGNLKKKGLHLIETVFLSKVISKKTSSRHRLFDLFHAFLLIFKKTRKGKEKGGWGGHCTEHFRGAKLHKKNQIGQNFYTKLPKILTHDQHLKTKWGGGSAPRPPTSYATAPRNLNPPRAIACW